MKIIRIVKISTILLFLFSIHAIAVQQGDSLTLPALEFKKQLDQKQGLLIDVRTPEEFIKEHIDGAKNINVKADNFDSLIGKLDKSKTYFLYCGIGKRGALAMGKMKKAGFTKLFNLEGGLAAWKKANLPIISK